MKYALPLILLATPAFGQGLPFQVAETGQRYARLQDALYAIGDATATIRIAPGRWRDCGVQTAGRVSYVATAPGRVIFDGTVCESKAALVLRGRSARVEGLIFANMRVADGNGAGIRLERGNLSVANSWFKDSEEGILAGNDAYGAISIDRSSFTHLGRCDRGLACAHSVYLGLYDRVTITNSRFEAGDGGHYIKTRSRMVDIRANVIDDTGGRNSNYLIDLPAGATGRIAGNWMVQGSHKENPRTIIAVSAESQTHPTDRLTIEGNTVKMAPGAPAGPALVRDWSGGRIVIGENILDDTIIRIAPGKGLLRQGYDLAKPYLSSLKP
jgi:hypothetical protein